MAIEKEEILTKVHQWIEIAEEDLNLAKHAFSMSSNIPYRLICFHCQQSAEKYLKAFLVYNLIDFPYTHEIEKLLNLIPAKYNLQSKLKNIYKLSDYAVAKRYPDFYIKLTKDEAEEAVGLAESVKIEIENLFKEVGINLKKKGSDFTDP